MENAKITNLYNLKETIAGDYLAQLTYPWEALSGLADFIRRLGPTLDPERYEQRGEDIWVAKNATVFENAYLHGPLIVDEEAEIRHCAFIRGSAIVGKHTVVGNSTELKNVILFNNVQVPHYNYVGDSILGYKSHMGAGSITSNVKSDKTLVVVKDRYDSNEEIETGLKKFGAMLGDCVEVGCNSVLNPGTVIGRESNIYPLSRVRGVIPERSIFKDAEHVVEKNI
jgi:NDP-sugar pyrophosphorylase family protein